jgi:galactose mutarotase-like enzyme
VPDLGNNCYIFKVADGDTWMDVIELPLDLATLKECPTAYGNPILFPFPNRSRGSTFTFEQDAA